jgi:hypothetical protein
MVRRNKTQKKRDIHRVRRMHKGGNNTGRTMRVSNLRERTVRPKCEDICGRESNFLMNAIIANNSKKEQAAKKLLDKCKEATRCV